MARITLVFGRIKAHHLNGKLRDFDSLASPESNAFVLHSTGMNPAVNG
jgi:hypothetical protein